MRRFTRAKLVGLDGFEKRVPVTPPFPRLIVLPVVGGVERLFVRRKGRSKTYDEQLGGHDGKA